MQELAKFLFGVFFASIFVSSCIAATPSTQPLTASQASWNANLHTLRALLKTPESQLDLAIAKLTIDRLVDPTTDVPGTLKQIDSWEAKIKARLPANASNRTKLDTMLSTLYEKGPWNDHRPFSYDLDDPIGKNIPNKLLSNYLTRRKGQCSSMPVLLVILGQRLELPVTLALAPNHLLTKYGDEDSGTWLNVEATSGGFKLDTSYERGLHISPEAINNQLYLRPLTQRESVGAMLLTLLEFHSQRREPVPSLALADLILELDPKNAAAMLWKSSAYYWLIQQRFKDVYPLAAQIPLELRHEYLHFSEQNIRWGKAAEALGYRESTLAQNADYLKSIVEEKDERR